MRRALQQAGLPSGGLLSSLALGAVALLPSEQLMSWGWRVPFLLSIILVILSYAVRKRMQESPLFAKAIEGIHSGGSVVEILE